MLPLHPLLISTPHSSDFVPDWIFSRMLETGEAEQALRHRILRAGDPFTDSIFGVPGAAVIVNATASRFVADLNRERGESGENGVIKLVDFDRRPFYPSGYTLTPEEKEKRLKLFYDPYHRELESALRGGSIRFLIDGHSMTAQGPALGPDPSEARPAICIGNFGDAEGDPVYEPVSCPPPLARSIRDCCAELLADLVSGTDLPKEVKLNQPFDGGQILRKYSHPAYAFRIPGVMIEVNRALYLDEEALRPIPGRIEYLRDAMEKLAKKISAATDV